MYKRKHVFVYDSHFKPFHQPKCCWDLIHNIAYATICVLGDKYRETEVNLKHALKYFFGGMWTVECAL